MNADTSFHSNFPASDLSGVIIGAALRIHSKLGPGLFESVYEAILTRDLQRLGHHVECQKAVPLSFEGLQFENAFRADLIVDGSILVEIKSIQAIAPVHIKQTLTYLKLLDFQVGLIINFGEDHLKHGIKRVINGPPGSSSVDLDQKVQRACESK